MKTSTETDVLAEALAAAQGEFPPIHRSKTVTVRTRDGNSYSFDYDPLDAIMDAVRPALAKWKLAVVQPVSFGEGAVIVTTRIQHGPQFYESELSFPLGEVTVKDLGGLITYLRRYALSPFLSVVAEMDDDGNASSGDQRAVTDRPAPVPNPACPECGSAAAVIKGKEEYGGGWVCWKKSTKGKGCGHQWKDQVDLPAKEDKPGPWEDSQPDPFGADSLPENSNAGDKNSTMALLRTKTAEISKAHGNTSDELIPPARLEKLLKTAKENDIMLWLASTLRDDYGVKDPAKLRLIHCDHLGRKMAAALKSQEAAIEFIRLGIKQGDSKKALLEHMAGTITLGPRWTELLEGEIAKTQERA